MFRKHTAWVLLATVWVAACSGTPGTPTPLTPTTAPVDTTAPTATLPPSSTALMTITPQPPLATLTPSPQPLEPTEDYTAIVNIVVTANPTPHQAATYPSPDGHSRAELWRYDCYWVEEMQSDTTYEQIALTDLSTGRVTRLEDQLGLCGGGLGAFGLAGLFWSADSRYFYYTTAHEGQPDGLCVSSWYRPIIRFEPATGEKISLSQGPQLPGAARFAGILGQSVIIWGQDDPVVTRMSTAVTGLLAGAVAWAPDGKSLAYLQWTSDCPQADGQSYVVRADLAGPAQSVLLPPGSQTFVKVVWDTPNRLRLFEADNTEWRYNLVTKTLTRFQ